MREKDGESGINGVKEEIARERQRQRERERETEREKERERSGDSITFKKTFC